jgi:predicted secreted protein
MKQTAVEWLYQHLFPKQLDGFSEEEWSKIDSAFEQAKEMEKQQIEDAFNKGFSTTSWDKTKENKATEYYEKTFNK